MMMINFWAMTSRWASCE